MHIKHSQTLPYVLMSVTPLSNIARNV